LSDEIASFLQQFASLQSPVIVLLVTIMSVFCTAFTSNVATATLLIPIAAQMVTMERLITHWVTCAVSHFKLVCFWNVAKLEI